MGKPELNLKEPDQALMWIKAFETRARVEKKRDIDATPGTSGPPAVSVKAKDYQVTDFFKSQCGLDALIKFSSLFTPRNIEDMKIIDIRKLLEATRDTGGCRTHWLLRSQHVSRKRRSRNRLTC